TFAFNSMEPFVEDFPEENSYKSILPGRPRTAGMKSGFVTVKPGESCGEHTTGRHEELLVVLEGDGRLVLPEKKYLEIRGGQAVYVPPETFHDVRNMGVTPLKYVYVVAPVTTGTEATQARTGEGEEGMRGGG
ncbi:MAG: cupin domain-containing protein, partial [bacterium]